MARKFYDYFGEKEQWNRISDGMLAVLNEEIAGKTDQLVYRRTESGVALVPVSGQKIPEMNSTFDVIPGQLPEGLAREDLLDYLYRTQKEIKVKNFKMRIGGIEGTVDQLTNNPLSQEQDDHIYVLKSTEFPPARPWVFETSDGCKQTIMMRRKPWESKGEVMLGNESFLALRLEIILREADHVVRFHINVNPGMADSVEDAIMALKIYRGLADGSVQIEGQSFGQADVNLDHEFIENSLSFWEGVRQLEEAMNLSFIPGADFPREDEAFFLELLCCFVEQKPLEYEHPFDSFVVGAIHGFDIRELVGKEEDLTFTTAEEPIEASFLGVKFVLHSALQLRGFRVLDCNPTEDGRFQLMIADNKKPWIMSRRYFINSAERDVYLKEFGGAAFQ